MTYYAALQLREIGRSSLSAVKGVNKFLFFGGVVAVGVVSAIFASLALLSEEIFRSSIQSSSYIPFILTPAGLVIVSLLTRRYFPNAKSSGIPQTIAALEMESHQQRSKLLSLRIAAGKVGMSLLALLSGASIGRGVPTVHIGASILYSIGRDTNSSSVELDSRLILAGGAAGLAAAFNAPLAGIVFALEELNRSARHHINNSISTSVILAALLAGVVAIIILGDYHYFGQSEASLNLGSTFNLTTISAVIVCGVMGGAIGGIFASTLIHGTRHITPLLIKHPILVPALCGVVIATAGLLSDNSSFGTGYREAHAFINGSYSDGNLASGFNYSIMKMVATIASFFSGIPGGILTPSLATGAGLGAGFAQWFPAELLPAMVLMGMVGYFAGVVQTPITAFVIVMEITDNQQMLLPLMATAFIAYNISKIFCPKPIYLLLAESFLDSDARDRRDHRKAIKESI
ncbi:MAG: chloride channel protein [Thiotrichales bacterium]|jgi:H+/Cl- antiporter ClcA|nr:chloride channel protein [Thiotrichales bacterium]MBT3613397.1 chloride channel protein [Thiotrichales bacterium]MBT3752496.1 chloride channel protein [Thiotrichales bacterium]MBT3837455.1 chloride channel protein [Thiotrichales bacterium]MBT4151438.1 chloride channel protein [Thiotrichales bacterium]